MTIKNEAVSGAVDERELHSMARDLYEQMCAENFEFVCMDGTFNSVGVIKEVWKRAALQPAQTAPLTDEQIDELRKKYEKYAPDSTGGWIEWFDYCGFARALLASQPTAAVSDERILQAAVGHAGHSDPANSEYAFTGKELIAMFRALLSHPAAPAQTTPAVSRNEIADKAWVAYEQKVRNDSMLKSVSVHQLRTAISVTIDAALSAPAAQQPSDFDSKAQRAEAWDAVVVALNAAKPDWMENNLSGMGAAVLAIKSATWQQPSETAIQLTEHDQSIIRDLEAMASDRAKGFWPQALASATLRIIHDLTIDRQMLMSKVEGLQTSLLGETAIHNAAINFGMEKIQQSLSGHRHGTADATRRNCIELLRSLLRPAAQEAEKQCQHCGWRGKEKEADVYRQVDAIDLTYSCPDCGKDIAAQEAEKPKVGTIAHARIPGMTPVGEVERLIIGAQEAAREQPAKGEK